MPSLRLELAPTGMSVLLTSDEVHTSALGRLASRFRSSLHQSPQAVTVPLDDFLANLQALANWPTESKQSVEWQPELYSLVEDSLADAKAAKTRLAAPGVSTAEISADELLDLLLPEWKGDLTGFQKRDICKLLSMRHGANFSVPGAGKTRVAFADFHVMRRRGEVTRMLVVAPKSAHGSWAEEAKLCFENPPAIHWMNEGHIDPRADVVLVNYERLSTSRAALSRWLNAAPSALVLDEAHRMKRGAAGVYGAVCMSLGPLARRRLALTGTPAPNGVKDLQNVFNFVWPGQGGRQVERATTGRTLHEASGILKPFFCRTTKDELGLPPLDARLVRVAFDGLHKEIYAAIRGDVGLRPAGQSEDELQKYGRIAMYLIMAATSPALLSHGASKYEPLPYGLSRLPVPEGQTLARILERLPRYEDSPKYQEARGIVAENAAQGRKTLVWSTFVRSLTTLKRMLAEFSPAVVHGATVDREEQLRRFRDDPECMVLLSNPATLGEGISLHHACHEAVYVDRDFTAGRFLQSLDRIHRLGLSPDTKTTVKILVAEETIDEAIEARLADKLRFMGAVLDDPGLDQLADLDEDPAAPAGLECSDLQTLREHLK